MSPAGSASGPSHEERINALLSEIETLLKDFPSSGKVEVKKSPRLTLRAQAQVKPKPAEPPVQKPIVLTPPAPAPLAAPVPAPAPIEIKRPIIDPIPTEPPPAASLTPLSFKDLSPIPFEPTPVAAEPSEAPTPATDAAPAPVAKAETGTLKLVAPVSEWRRFVPSKGELIAAVVAFPEGRDEEAKTVAADLESSTLRLAGRVFGVKVFGFFAHAAEGEWHAALKQELGDKPVHTVAALGVSGGSLVNLRKTLGKVHAFEIPARVEDPKAFYFDALLELVSLKVGMDEAPQVEIAMPTVQTFVEMGVTKATRALSQMLEQKTQLTIADLRWLSLSELSRKVRTPDESTIGVSLELKGEVEGRALVIIPPHSVFDLCDMLLKRRPHETGQLAEAEQAALKDFGNTIAHSYLTSLTFSSGMMGSYSLPVFANAHFRTVLEGFLGNVAEGVPLSKRFLRLGNQVIAGGFRFDVDLLIFLAPASALKLAMPNGRAA